MSAAEAAEPTNLGWLFGLQRFGAREGLDVMRQLLQRLGSPQDSFRSVLVGGTNGKGSVASLVAAQLSGAGHRTGLFTSPHLQRVGERARVDGQPADDALMEALTAEVRPAAQEVEATFFEVITAVALLRFQRAGVSHAVLEVGLGGRLDATNVVQPELTVITGIALDHTAILGDTEVAIAREKAGILRPGVPLVTGATGAALELLRRGARQLGAPLLVAGQAFGAVDATDSWDGVAFRLRWAPVSYPGAPSALARPGDLALRSPLVGAHQVNNVSLAAVAGLCLGVPPAVSQRALAAARWPGRLERFQQDGRYVVLDGAHNPQAAAALAASLKELQGRVDVLVLGTSREKDAPGILAPLAGIADTVIFTRARHSPRATPPSQLRALWRGEGALSEDDPAAALEQALGAAPAGGTVVVAGSLFLVGEVRNLLQGLSAEPYERWQ